VLGPLKRLRNCGGCSQEFRPTNWKQRHCKSCGLPARLESQRPWKRAYCWANRETILAKARVRWALRERGAPPLRKGHPYSPPRDASICVRCGVDFMPSNGNQRFCLPCRPLATSEVKRVNEKEYRQRSHAKVWKEVFGHYSHSSFSCACCGESEPDFLTLDHINNDGGEQRKSMGHRAGNTFYGWLLRNGLPSGIQVYCSDCNSSKAKHGECIHKQRNPPPQPTTLELWIS